MHEINATLTLLENIIIKNCHEEKTMINLFFTTNVLINKLIKCDIDRSMKNSFDYLFVETCVKFRLVKKSTRRFRRDWKLMNFEKFEQYFETHLSKLLSKAKSTSRNSLRKTQFISLWDGLRRVFETSFDLFNSSHEFRDETSFLWVKFKSKISRIWLNKRDNKREDSKWSWDEELIQRSLQIHKIILENVTHLLFSLLHFTYDLIEQSIARC